jgi:hypothetical protein
MSPLPPVVTRGRNDTDMPLVVAMMLVTVGFFSGALEAANVSLVESNDFLPSEPLTVHVIVYDNEASSGPAINTPSKSPSPCIFPGKVVHSTEDSGVALPAVVPMSANKTATLRSSMTMIDGASVGFLDEQVLAGHVGTHAIGRKDPLDGFVDSIDGGPSPLSFLALINKDSWLPVTPTVTL